MRTSREVYHQLRWDPRFEPADYALGYRDRSGQMKQIRLVEFIPEGDIPWHRVWTISGPEGVVWDRAARLDRLSPGAARRKPPATLRVLTWNLMCSRHEEDRAERFSRFQFPEAEIVCFQELELPVQGMIGCGSVWLRTPTPPVQVLLNEDRAVVVELAGGLRVAALHLTSDRQPRAAEKRRSRLLEVLELLGEGPALLLGDLNAEPRELDAWDLEGWQRALCGPTFDARANELTRRTSSRVAQLDHVLARGFELDTCELLLGPSDHFGLLVRLRPHAELTRKTALAIVPPRELWGPIQALRRERDSGYERWMPHLTLRFPFVPDLAREAERLEAVLADFPPFTLRLDRMGSFGSRLHFIGPSHSPELQELYRRVSPSPGEFRPHLTVARGAAPPPLEPLEFRVESVHLLEGPPYISRYSVPLQSPEPPAWLREACPGRLYLTGAAARGVPTEDEDWVWQGGPLKGELRGVRVPRVLSRGVDLTAVESDMPLHRLDLKRRMALKDTAASAVWDHEALRSELDRRFLLPTARRLWREICGWAREQQIYGQAFGYPGGLGWCLGVACALLRDRQDIPEFLSGWPWPRPMALFEGPHRMKGLMPILTPIEPFQNAARSVFPSSLKAILRALRGEPEPDWAHRLVIPFEEPSRLLALMVALDKAGVTFRPRPEKTRLVLELGFDADLAAIGERVTKAGYPGHFFL